MKSQKRIAAQLLKCGINRVRFNPEAKEEIKKAITKEQIRDLIKEKKIFEARLNEQSRFRSRKIKKQRRKGLRKREGSRKGKKKARTPAKEKWMIRIRLQRGFLKNLKEKNKIEKKVYRDLYLKAKAGYFRNLRHLKIYLNESKLIK